MNNKLTRKDIEEMQAEIDHRKLVERPKLLEEVKETRAQGDLSENFEYHVAKRAKNQNERSSKMTPRKTKRVSIRRSLSIFRKMTQRKSIPSSAL